MAYIAKINAGGTDHLIGSSLYGYCDTAAATVAKVVSIAGFDTLISGVTIHVMFKYTNTATSPTLNVSSTGAKPIYAYGTTATGKAVGSNWCANAVVALTYSTNTVSTGAWMVNDYIANTDTNTKVTSAANHYAPTADSSSALTSPSSATTGVTFVDQVGLSRDAKGHVTAVTASTHALTKADITGLGIPGSDTNTTYTFATGSANGTISVTPSGGSAADVAVKGLASGAYAAAYTHPSDGANTGTFGSATQVAKVTVNAAGHVTGVSNVTISGVTPASHTHGNVNNNGTITADGVTIASGDAIVITDASATNAGTLVKTSITFDGSTATKALTQKGTWETFNNYSHPTSAGNKHIPSGGSSGQFLGWSAAGTAAWVNNPNTNTTYTFGTGSVGSASGWSAGTAASASVASGVLTITNGTAPSLTVTSTSVVTSATAN